MILARLLQEYSIEITEMSWCRMFLIAVLFGSLSTSFADSPTVDAERHLADVFYSEFRDVIELQLDESGLSSAEIERISSEAADKYAACVIEAISKINDPAANRFLKLLSEGLSAAEIDDQFGDATAAEFESFFETYESLVSPCRQAANSELGLPPNNDDWAN